MISDNGTQFVGAEKELKEMVNGWKLAELREFCAEKGMKWRFTTPKSPSPQQMRRSVGEDMQEGVTESYWESNAFTVLNYTHICWKLQIW